MAEHVSQRKSSPQTRILKSSKLMMESSANQRYSFFTPSVALKFCSVQKFFWKFFLESSLKWFETSFKKKNMSCPKCQCSVVLPRKTPPTLLRVTCQNINSAVVFFPVLLLIYSLFPPSLRALPAVRNHYSHFDFLSNWSLSFLSFHALSCSRCEHAISCSSSSLSFALSLSLFLCGSLSCFFVLIPPTVLGIFIMCNLPLQRHQVDWSINLINLLFLLLIVLAFFFFFLPPHKFSLKWWKWNGKGEMVLFSCLLLDFSRISLLVVVLSYCFSGAWRKLAGSSHFRKRGVNKLPFWRW